MCNAFSIADLGLSAMAAAPLAYAAAIGAVNTRTEQVALFDYSRASPSDAGPDLTATTSAPPVNEDVPPPPPVEDAPADQTFVNSQVFLDPMGADPAVALATDPVDGDLAALGFSDAGAAAPPAGHGPTAVSAAAPAATPPPGAAVAVPPAPAALAVPRPAPAAPAADAVVNTVPPAPAASVSNASPPAPIPSPDTAVVTAGSRLRAVPAASAPSPNSGSFSPQLSGSGASFQAVEGGLANSQQGFSGLPAVNPVLRAAEGVGLTNVTTTTFAAADPNAIVGDYAATIAWGDGASSAGTVVAAPGGGFAVTGSHTYAEEGSFTVTTTIADVQAGMNTSGTAQAVVADAALTAASVDFTAAAGTAAAVTVATFTDADPNGGASDYHANIDWGDGTSGPGTVAAASGGGFSVSGSHNYAQGGRYPVAVTISDASSNGAQTVYARAKVSDPSLTAGSVTVTPAGEGASTGVVAAFNDSRLGTSASAFQAVVDWGDGDSGGATVTAVNGAFQVSASHAYLDAGAYTVTVTTTHPDGDTLVQTGTVTVSDASLTAAGATAYAGAGSAANLTVATFQDADPNAAPSDFTALIAWGDGTSGAGTVLAAPNGGFAVSGTHVYTAPATFLPMVTITDETSTATATGHVVVSTVTATAQPFAAAEGVASNVTVATFTDSLPVAATASINWGDGTAATAGVVSGANGNYTVTGSHNYAEGGAYLATVTITNTSGQPTVLTVPATVADAALTATGSSFAAVAGAAAAVAVATFTDADPNATPASFSATVDWGDGSSPSYFNAITQNGTTFTVNGGYTYFTPGTYTVTTTITDAGGAVAVTTSTATVAAAPLTATAATINSTEGVAANMTVATFTGTAGGYAATIAWGDGSTTTAGTISGTNVTGSHTYAEAGAYTVTVTVTDAANHTAVASGTANVADATLTGTAAAVTGVQGQAFSGVVATFADANPGAPLADYTAVITWGDGAVTGGTVSRVNGVLSVSGSNTYFEAGSYAVQVTLTDVDGATATVSRTATVADAPLTGTVASLGATQGAALNGVTVSAFTDPFTGGSASDYTATIDWGDGTAPTTGVVGGSDGSYGVVGSHTYAQAGAFTIRVTVSDAGGGATFTGSAQVSAPPAYVVANFTAYDPNNPQGPPPPPSAFTATINWGDGTAPTSGVVASAGGNGYTVSGPHAYAEEGQYNVIVTVAQQGAGTTTFFAAANVMAAPIEVSRPPGLPADYPAASIQEEDVLVVPGQVEPVTSDDGKTVFSQPKWQAGGALVQDPIAIVSGNNLELSKLIFVVGKDPAAFDGPVTAVGYVSGVGIPAGMTISTNVGFDLGEKKYLSIQSRIGLAQSNKPFDHVTNQGIVIVWDLTLADGRQVFAGVTGNRLYVTLKAPSTVPGQPAKPLYETVLKTGSVYNDGNPDTDASVLVNAWKEFETLKILRADMPANDPKSYLTYYGSYHTGNSTTPLLLANGEGDSDAFSMFLIDVLEAQGHHETDWLTKLAPKGLKDSAVPDMTWGILIDAWKFQDPPAVNFLGTVRPAFFPDHSPFYANALTAPFVKGLPIPWLGDTNYVWKGTPQVTQSATDVNEILTKVPHIPGQNNPLPSSLFLNHVVVTIGGKIYDPSYGVVWRDATNFQVGAVNGFWFYQPVPLDANGNYAAGGTNTPVLLFLKGVFPLNPYFVIQPVKPDNANY